MADALPADAPEPLLDASAADTDSALADGPEAYLFDTAKLDLPSAPDAPVFDSVAAFDQWPTSDLGQRYDPDIWQEFPYTPDSDEPSDAWTAVDSDADAATPPDADATTDADAPPDADAAPAVDVPPGADAATDADPPTDANAVADADVPASADLPQDAVGDALADAAADAVVDAADASDPDLDAAGDAADAAEVDAAPSQDAQDAQTDASQPDVPADSGPACQKGGCDDGEPCTVDSCLASGQCAHAALPSGVNCSEGVCHQGFCSRNTAEMAGTSCMQLKQAIAGSKSGVWWLDPDGPFGVWQPYPVWCDMVAEGGGWTLLLKVDHSGALGYDSPLWTSIATLHPGFPRLDEHEAKFDSYWSVPHTELRIGMHVANQVAWLVLPIQGTSLFHLMKDDKAIETSLPTAKWLGLLPGAKLQSECKAQGLNINPGKGQLALYNHARVRIGLVGNAENDCQTPDSRIGLGGAGGTCGQSPTMTCGNAAGCYDGAQVANHPAIGYVLAR